MSSSARSSTTGCWIVIACALLTRAARLPGHEAGDQRRLREDDSARPRRTSRITWKAAAACAAWAIRCAWWSRTPTATSSIPAYLEVLKQVNDELFLMADVDRAWMKSIWTPAVRWSEVNEEGFVGGPVMPDNYDGSPDVGGCAQAQHPPRQHRRQPGGQRLPSSMVFVPLLEPTRTPAQRLDYHAFSQKLEQRVRAKYENGRRTARSRST